jgi:predicted ribosome quality control (RQC) complex YloA/Tae2 family protein
MGMTGMDNQTIEAIMNEVADLLAGAAVSKIYQPSSETLIFKLWTGRETHRLLISVASGRARIHLTRQAYPNPPAPARFCQLLRARLARLLRMEQVPGERIVRLVFSGAADGSEEPPRYTLMAELIGHHGNLVLLNEQGRIVDVLKRTKGDGRRELLPGREYQPPPFSPGASRKDETSFPRPSSPSPSQAADDYYARREGQSDGMDERRALQTVVRRQLKRLATRKHRIQHERSTAEGAEGLRQAGELLLANLHRLRTGMTAVELENYYADPPTQVTIQLEPRLTPRENAERYFQRYKKLKRSRDHIARRIAETEEELSWLENVGLALEEAETADDLGRIRRELADARLLQPMPPNPVLQRSADPARGVKEALSPNGYRLYWGTSNRVNDYVSRHLCKPEDLWFHALNRPGCHLVLKRKQGDEVPSDDQLYAASLAAGYSRGKGEGKVEVMVAEGKWVKKPKGARPGLVVVKQYRTLVVVPRRTE